MDAKFAGVDPLTGTKYPVGTALEQGAFGWQIARPTPDGKHSRKCRLNHIGVMFGGCTCWLSFQKENTNGE